MVSGPTIHFLTKYLLFHLKGGNHQAIMADELPIQLHEILSVFVRLRVNHSDQVASNRCLDPASKQTSCCKRLQLLDGIACELEINPTSPR